MPETSEVLLLLVLCANFAQCLEGTKIGGKRARTKNVKYFSTFWTDGYKLHLSTAHTEKWEEYQDKEVCLQVHWMPLETPCMHIWNLQATLEC